MNKTELIQIAKDLGIEYYNECEEYICLKGINAQSTLIFTDKAEIRASWQVKATMKDFATHLKQMGRDSLKMDLNTLLSITHHS